MTIHTDNMSTVAAWGEALEPRWYRVRVSKVSEETSDTGNPTVKLQLKVQDEGPNLGRVIVDFPSLQPHALAKLKAYYDAVGYKPGPEGHDPERLLDGELYVKTDTEVYQGTTRNKVAPYNIRSIQQGPGQV